MGETEPDRGRGAGGGVALAFGVAALAASWNPVAAPFGLLVGIAAALLGARALRRARSGRRVPATALAMGVLAAVASVVVLLLTTGAVGVDLPGEPVVKGRTQVELEQVLSQAEERTRAQRERASKELDRLSGPGSGASPTPPPPRRGAARDGGGSARGPTAGDPP